MSETQRSSLLGTHSVPRRHLQVVPLAQQYGAAADRAPTAPARDLPTWAERLSNREIEVLECIAAGLSTNEIAQTLFISTATVKSHIARLITKVEVRDRLQLVIAAYRTGFIQVS